MKLARNVIFALLWLPAVAFPDTQPATRPRISLTSFVDSLKVDDLLIENRLSNWMFLLGAIVAGVLLGRVAAFLLCRIGKRLENRGWVAHSHFLTGASGPLNLAFIALGLGAGLAQIVMSDALGDFSRRIMILLYTTAIFWYAFNLVGVIEVALHRITKRTHAALDDELVPVIRKSLRIFIVVIGTLFILQNVFERDIGAWLAGLGIAGLAVSLAAQDSLKNLFGSVTILFDRPFTVGQRIRYAGHDGVVENVGFRSVKVRTLDGNQVTIPNSSIVNDPVENVGARPYIRRVMNITITYDTPTEKVQQAVQIVRDLLASEEFRGPIHDPDTIKNVDPPRAFFDDFNSDSLNIKVFYWYRPPDYWAYLDHAQRFNLALMRAFEQAGIDFAFPTRTLYLASDPKRKLGIEQLDDDASADPRP